MMFGIAVQLSISRVTLHNATQSIHFAITFAHHHTAAVTIDSKMIAMAKRVDDDAKGTWLRCETRVPVQ